MESTLRETDVWESSWFYDSFTISYGIGIKSRFVRTGFYCNVTNTDREYMKKLY
jgi:hypothetical protein